VIFSTQTLFTPQAQLKTALFFLAAGLFGVVFALVLLVQPGGDMSMHLSYAAQMRSLADISSPHFLFQLLVKSLVAVGMADQAAAVVILAACYGGMALLIANEIEHRGGTLTIAVALLFVPLLLIASHIFLFTLPRANLYAGYFVPVSYHNPTQQLNKLFAVWIWFRFFRQFADASRPSWRQAGVTGALCVLSAVAKPSFLVAFLPVAAWAGAVTLLKRQWNVALQIAVGIGLPSAAVLLAQAWMTYGSSGAGVIFSPFAVFALSETIYKLPLSLAFPLVVGAMALRAGWLDLRLRYAWLYTAVALFVTLFLAESQNTNHGNFAWTGQTGVFLAYVESALYLVRRSSSAPADRAAWSVFALHVLSGVIWYFAVSFGDVMR
jgi:hypothetical protein